MHIDKQEGLQGEIKNESLAIEKLEMEKVILKNGIDKLLRGIEFSLDENISRRAITSRLKECRREAIELLLSKPKK